MQSCTCNMLPFGRDLVTNERKARECATAVSKSHNRSLTDATRLAENASDTRVAVGVTSDTHTVG